MNNLSKNEILVSKVALPNCASGASFVVKQSAATPNGKVTIRILDKDNVLHSKGFDMKLSVVDKYFTRTNRLYKETTSSSNFKKGDLLQVKKSFKNSNSSKAIKVGSRAILHKGGKKIELELACCPYEIYSPNDAFMKEYFEPAEPIFDQNLNDVGIKNLKSMQGEETPCFHYDFTYKGKVVGYAKNSGSGEANSLIIHDSKELRDIFNILIADIAKSTKKNEFRISELLVDYFHNNFHKGLCTFETYVQAH